MNPSARLWPSIIGAVGVVLWAAETTLVNLAPRVPPLEVVALAFCFAASLSPFVWLLTGQSPLAALRVPKQIWLLTVTALVGYHFCIYFATQRAPAAPAALLQGTTPLMIVLGSALLPGERLKWWHVVGAGMGFVGVLLLINAGGETAQAHDGAVLYLSMIGAAAGLWGLYAIVTRSLPDIPSSSLGAFYVASAVVSFAGHFIFEQWVAPTVGEWLAIAGLGILPMGLAIYLWDYGVKKGDIQALGAFAYTEPFIGALLVALITGAALGLELLWSGALVVGGAIVASASLIRKPGQASPSTPSFPQATRAELEVEAQQAIERLIEIEARNGLKADHAQVAENIRILRAALARWNELDQEGTSAGKRRAAA